MPAFGIGCRADSIARFCKLAEELGYESIWLGDHIVVPSQVRSPYPYSSGHEYPAGRVTQQRDRVDILVGLGFIAALTRTVRIGTNVLVAPYRHPVVTAKALAFVDVLSGGRLHIGVGSGWMSEQFDAVGAAFGERGLRTDETIEVWKRLWSEDGASHQGRYFSFDNISVVPRPLQRPHPPIVIGGNSEASLRRTVRHGDGVQLIVAGLEDGYDLEIINRTLSRLRFLCEESGRSFPRLDISVTMSDGPGVDVATSLERVPRYEHMGVGRLILGFPALMGDDDNAESALRAFAGAMPTLRSAHLGAS